MVKTGLKVVIDLMGEEREYSGILVGVSQRDGFRGY